MPGQKQPRTPWKPCDILWHSLTIAEQKFKESPANRGAIRGDGSEMTVALPTPLSRDRNPTVSATEVVESLPQAFMKPSTFVSVLLEWSGITIMTCWIFLQTKPKTCSKCVQSLMMMMMMMMMTMMTPQHCTASNHAGMPKYRFQFPIWWRPFWHLILGSESAGTFLGERLEPWEPPLEPDCYNMLQPCWNMIIIWRAPDENLGERCENLMRTWWNLSGRSAGICRNLQSMLKPKPDWNWLGIQLGNLFGTLLEHYWNLTEARRRNQSLKTNLDVYHEPCLEP